MPKTLRLFACAALAACAAQIASLPTLAADLRIALASEVTSLDPHYFNVAANNNIAWHVFDALTRVDENARLVPGLAESWRAVDATTWEFKLRKGIRFHDGAELTAEDVVFSLERPATIANSPGSFVPFTRQLVQVRAPDRYTVVLKTERPYAMVPYDVNSIFIVSRRAARRAGTEEFNSGRAAVGTGPYRLARFARGDRVELVRHDAHWEGRPAWDKVIFRMVPNNAARTAALLAGDVDLIEQIPPADVVKLRANGAVHLAQKVSWRTIFFHLEQGLDRVPSITGADGRPLDRNPLKDVRVRRAISKAINRQAIAERVMEGLALPAGNLVSPGVFGHAADLKPEIHDPEGAKKLLAAAGFPDGFGLVVHAPNDRYVNDDRVAQAVAQMLARVGIRARVTTLPFSVYVSKARNREFAFAMLGWGSYSGDLALRSLVATFDAAKGYGTWNWGRYSDPRLDALTERALATVDPTAREPIAQDAMRAAMASLAVIPLHHQIATWAMRRDLDYAARTDEYTLAHHVRPR